MIDIVGSVIDAMMGQDALPNAIKTMADVDRYEAIIEAVAPAIIVELGTNRGGSALWLAETAGCPVITVDVVPQVPLDVFQRWDGDVVQVIGDSIDPQVIAEVEASVKGADGPVMVILDSDHSAGHVYAELCAYAPLVTPGSYCAVEDTLVRWMPWWGYAGSPLDAAENWLAEHPGEWINDLEVENMSERSQNPGGWLRRVR